MQTTSSTSCNGSLSKPQKPIHHHITTEQQIIHLMLKSLSCVEEVIAAGVTADLFDGCHQRIVRSIFKLYEHGHRLTMDGYRNILIDLGKKARTKLPMSMEVFAKCQVQAYAVPDDLPGLIAMLFDHFVGRICSSALNKFTKDIEETDHIYAARNLVASITSHLEEVQSAQSGGLTLIGIDEVKAEPVDWLWERFIAKGAITLLTGLWKAGKTTLISILLKQMSQGGDIAGKIRPSQIIYVTEEGATTWRVRKDKYDISGSHLRLAIRPFSGKPSKAQWEGLLNDLAKEIEKSQVDLVVIDPLSMFMPCDDENDSAKMMSALAPLHKLTNAGAAVLIIHHPRKSGGMHGTASRGSGALPGFVDIILELERATELGVDNRRTLKGMSRFTDSFEVTLALENGTYVESSNRISSPHNPNILVLPETEEGALTAEQIAKITPGHISERQVRNIVKTCPQVERIGTGGKGDPYRYFRKDI